MAHILMYLGYTNNPRMSTKLSTLTIGSFCNSFNSSQLVHELKVSCEDRPKPPHFA